MIPVDELFAKWNKDPAFRKAYEALEEEYALAAAIIQARANAGLTQRQLACRMKTTEAAIVRLESGRSNRRRERWSG